MPSDSEKHSKYRQATLPSGKNSRAGLLRPIALALLATAACCASASAEGWQHLGAVQRVEKLKDGVELFSGPAKVRINVFRDGVIRVRVAPQGNFPKDSSWAVVETPEAPPLKIEDAKNEVRLTAGRVVVIVQKSPLLVNFADAEGHILLADEPTLPMAWDGQRIRIWKKMPADENYYGLGDKPGPMNRRNRAFTMWNTDAYGWDESTDPLYKAIPFFLGLRNGAAYGVFFDNTYRTSFDFGKESPDYYSFGSEGGELNYYFLVGPQPKKVIEEYTALAGRAPLPPLWSLGYQQCRYSYYPEARVREVARLLREKKIPADVIYLDIDYQDGYAPFTINREYFPHFEQMIADLRAQGFHTVLITDLHIKKNAGHGYAPYDSGSASDVFVKNPDGSVFVGAVWPGDSVFPDFTLSRVRDWWGGLYKDFVGMGVAGFWNDMNEPSVFKRADQTMPLDIVHRLDDGTTLDHRAVHNAYGMQNARATYEGLRKLQADERPFVLTRAAYSGTQRYAATWTGDNSATWNHIWMSTPMLLSLGISGYALAGDDIGGFASSPPPDLLTRWYELGVFNPIYRDHAAKDTADHEPWASGPEHEAIRRRYIELRYQLLPYIYTGTEEMTRTGVPLMRPVWLDYPQAGEFYGDNRDFLFGRDFFVAPVTTETTDPEEVHLPPGEWYDYWTAQKHASTEKIALRPALEEVPLFVRSGAIIPMQPVVQSTGEKPNGPLKLRVYPGEECAGSLYEDDGHTFAYQKGEFLRVNYSCQASTASIRVAGNTEKLAFPPWWDTTEVTIFGAAAAPKEVRVRDKVIQDWRYDSRSHAVILAVPGAADWNIQLAF
jgi:alpha-glucosidase